LALFFTQLGKLIFKPVITYRAKIVTALFFLKHNVTVNWCRERRYFCSDKLRILLLRVKMLSFVY